MACIKKNRKNIVADGVKIKEVSSTVEAKAIWCSLVQITHTMENGMEKI